MHFSGSPIVHVVHPIAGILIGDSGPCMTQIQEPSIIDVKPGVSGRAVLREDE